MEEISFVHRYSTPLSLLMFDYPRIFTPHIITLNGIRESECGHLVNTDVHDTIIGARGSGHSGMRQTYLYDRFRDSVSKPRGLNLSRV
jgi:hypothetical protein